MSMLTGLSAFPLTPLRDGAVDETAFGAWSSGLQRRALTRSPRSDRPAHTCISTGTNAVVSPLPR